MNTCLTSFPKEKELHVKTPSPKQAFDKERRNKCGKWEITIAKSGHDGENREKNDNQQK